MKIFLYLRYFFFIALNWNLRLAWFTIRHEIRGERKYGINTTGLTKIKELCVESDPSHAENYQGSNYYLLEKHFEYLQSINANHSITDFGCGKGRVLAVAAAYEFQKITGVDFAKELCDEARKNITPIQERFPEKIFNIICDDVRNYKIEDDAEVFFFFNPFDEVVMLAVVKNILASLKKAPREVYVVYINPLHKEIFLSAGFEQVFYEEKFHYIQGSIFMKPEEN